MTACVGALTAGKLIGSGRRRTLFLILILLTVYGFMTQFMNFWAILFARAVAGYSFGVKQVAVNRYIEEYVPLATYAVASTTNSFTGQVGYFLALLSALVLPPEKAPVQDYYDNVSWRYIFGFSFVLIAIGLIGLLCFIRNDSPKLYLTACDMTSALKSI